MESKSSKFVENGVDVSPSVAMLNIIYISYFHGQDEFNIESLANLTTLFHSRQKFRWFKMNSAV